MNQLEITYWTLVALSLLLIVIPVITLLRWRSTEPNSSKPIYMAILIFIGVCLYAAALIVQYYMKEEYSGEGNGGHVYSSVVQDGDGYDGIGDISIKNDPRENKIPNLSTQTATDLVDYTTIRTSLTNSLSPPPFGMGAQAMTRIKSPPHGF
jgi:hypothetical protein